ncbi:MAG: integration host factor subunit alpha [Deltaproteobacteria bacterium]|nr:integration host factor subunit alpha [Deltaproteobacteria bacterium]
MTKTDIVEGVYERLGGFSKKEAAAIVETILDVMKDALTDGEKVKISSFGTFTVRAKKKRRGRNPKTGKTLEISARKVLTFKPSQVLKSLLNS